MEIWRSPGATFLLCSNNFYIKTNAAYGTARPPKLVWQGAQGPYIKLLVVDVQNGPGRYSTCGLSFVLVYQVCVYQKEGSWCFVMASDGQLFHPFWEEGLGAEDNIRFPLGDQKAVSGVCLVFWHRRLCQTLSTRFQQMFLQNDGWGSGRQ